MVLKSSPRRIPGADLRWIRRMWLDRWRSDAHRLAPGNHNKALKDVSFEYICFV